MVLSPTLAEFLLFQPSRGDPGDPPTLAGVRGESLPLRTSDGVTIQAWWYPVRTEGPEEELAEARRAFQLPAVLVLHGNAGDISHRTPIARGLLQEGCSVLLLEYRGYGGSGGSPSEEGLYLDALAGYEFLSERLGGSASIMVLGRSMGGAVAARLAATRATGGLVLESAFTSLEAMGRILYPFLPGIFFRRLRGRFDTLGSLRDVKVPILVVHGARDEIVPLRMGRTLYEAAGARRQWHEVPGAGHNDVFQVGGREYFRVIGGFFKRYGRGEPRDQGLAP